MTKEYIKNCMSPEMRNKDDKEAAQWERDKKKISCALKLLRMKLQEHAKVKFMHEKATFKKAHDSDSGFDLTCCGYEYKENGLWCLKLGVAVEPPEGYYFELVPRSSFSKTPFMFANNVGIIDQGYRGEWLFPVRHLHYLYYDNIYCEAPAYKRATRNDIEKYLLHKRIAQAILRKYEDCEIEIISELSETKRGTNGFGSSGT